MRAISVHPDAIVVTSLFWQCNAIALRAGEEAMLIDSPYFPDELELLPGVLAQSGFEPNALLATHGDFDHMLGRLAFPDLALGVAESTMRRIRERPGEAQRELRDYDAEAYVERAKPLRQIDADLAYLDALERGEERPSLPEGRDSKRQHEIHAENLAQTA